MKIEEHIHRSMEAAERGEVEHALLHACIAVDATSRKRFHEGSSRENFIKFVREYYWILEPMIGGRINMEETEWSNIILKDARNREIPKKDIAAFIYHAFRCTQAHGEEIEPVFKLLPRGEGGELRYHFADGRLHIPDTIVWALNSICVFAKANSDISTNYSAYLTLGINQFAVSDWWGLEESFRPIAEKHNQRRVKLDLGALKHN